MLFDVDRVTIPECSPHLNRELEAKGQTGEIPVNPQSTAVLVPGAEETTK
jgi:hypothetical protein